MILNYPDKKSLKEVLCSRLAAHQTREFCKRRGVVQVGTSQEAVGQYAHLFFWGCNDINELSSMLETEKNYKRSIRVNCRVSPREQDASGRPPLEEFLEILTAQESAGTRSSRVEATRVAPSGPNEAELVFRYVRTRSGINDLLKEETRHIPARLTQQLDGSLSVDVYHKDSADITAVKELFSDLRLLESQPYEVKANMLSLEGLTTRERLSAFVSFFQHRFPELRLSAVRSIKVNKHTDSEPDPEDAVAAEEEVLQGISSALLGGNALLTNPFVQKCLASGFFFSSARIQYEHLREPIQFEIELAVKDKSVLMEISMTASWEIVDDKPLRRPLSEKQQEGYLASFTSRLSEIIGGIVANRSQNGHPNDNSDLISELAGIISTPSPSD